MVELRDLGTWLSNAANLTTVLTAIAAIIFAIRSWKLRRQNKEFKELNPSLEVLSNFECVWKRILEIFEQNLSERGNIEIKNIGLDLEKILPGITDYVEKEAETRNTFSFKYQGLLIHPDAPFIKPIIDGPSNIRTPFVKASHERIALLKTKMVNPRFSFEIRSYNFPPPFHGIVINGTHLFLGFTEIRNGKLFGADNPYIYLKYDAKVAATKHYFEFFEDWFDYYWNYEG